MHNGEASLRQGDTAARSIARHVELLRGMSPEERLEVALSLSEAARELSLAGLHRLYPGDDDLALRARLASLVYGAAAGDRLRAALARRAR